MGQTPSEKMAILDTAAKVQVVPPAVDIHRIIMNVFGVSRRRSVRDNLPLNTAIARGRTTLGVLFKELNFTEGAEIGTSKGKFANVLCQANPTLHLTCVDAWSARFGGAQSAHDHNFRAAQKLLRSYHVTYIRKPSMEALPDIPDASLDFVYIDAGHRFDECMPDIVFWPKKVKSGGIVACHDYFNNFQYGVIQAVNAYTHCHRIDPWYVTLELYPSAFWVNP